LFLFADVKAINRFCFKLRTNVIEQDGRKTNEKVTSKATKCSAKLFFVCDEYAVFWLDLKNALYYFCIANIFFCVGCEFYSGILAVFFSATLVDLLMIDSCLL